MVGQSRGLRDVEEPEGGCSADRAGSIDDAATGRRRAEDARPGPVRGAANGTPRTSDHAHSAASRTPHPGGAAPVDDEPEPADTSRTPRASRARRARHHLTGPAVRIAFLILAIALGIYAVARQWTQVRAGFAEIGPLVLLAALALALLTCFATFAVWRGLLAAFGSPLPRRDAARVFFVGQLGKYVPGSVWSVVAQMELGKKHAVPRSRSAAVAAVTMLVSLTTALLVAAATLPWASDSATDGYLWAFAAAPVLLIGLHPRIANPALQRLFRLIRRPPMERPLTGAALFQATTRSLISWVLAGLHIWLLAVQLGAPAGQTFLLAAGGFAFAWAVGFLIVFAPAGAGIRELILVAALSPVLDPGRATAVALASRLVTILADLLAAGLAAHTHRRHRLTRGRRSADREPATDAAPATADQRR
jgi:uncharacterized membrane protein YbhN (UPF0104 family)